MHNVLSDQPPIVDGACSARPVPHRSFHASYQRGFFGDPGPSHAAAPQQEAPRPKDAFRSLPPKEADRLIGKAFEHSKDDNISADEILRRIALVESFYAKTNNLAWQNIIRLRLKSTGLYRQETVTLSSGSQAVTFSRLRAGSSEHVSSPISPQSTGTKSATAKNVSSTQPSATPAHVGSSIQPNSREQPSEELERRKVSREEELERQRALREAHRYAVFCAKSSTLNKRMSQLEEQNVSLPGVSNSRRADLPSVRRWLKSEVVSKIRLRLQAHAARVSRIDHKLSELASQGFDALGLNRRWRENVSGFVESYLHSTVSRKKVERAQSTAQLIDRSFKQLDDDIEQYARQEHRTLFLRRLKQSYNECLHWNNNFKNAGSITTLTNSTYLKLRSGLQDISDIIRNPLLLGPIDSKVRSRPSFDGMVTLLLPNVERRLRDNLTDIAGELHCLRHLINTAAENALAPAILGHRMRWLRIDHTMQQYATGMDSACRAAERMSSTYMRESQAYKRLEDLVLWYWAFQRYTADFEELLYKIRINGLRFPKTPLESYIASAMGPFYTYRATKRHFFRLVRHHRTIVSRRRLSEASEQAPVHHGTSKIEETLIQRANELDENVGTGPEARALMAALQEATLALGIGWLYRSSKVTGTKTIVPSKRLRELEMRELGYTPIAVPPPSRDTVSGQLARPEAVDFYPQRTSVPVDYVFTERAVHRSLQILCESRVLGLDLRTDGVDGRLQQLMLANNNRVVIISPFALGKLTFSPLVKALCNPTIVKVGFDMKRKLSAVNRSFGIQAEGFLDLGARDSGSTDIVRHVSARPNIAQLIRTLAELPHAALRIYRDRYGFHKDEAIPDPGSMPGFGPLLLDQGAEFRANAWSGLSNTTRHIKLVSRKDCLIDLGRNMAIERFLAVLRSPHPTAAIQSMENELKNETAAAKMLGNLLNPRGSFNARRADTKLRILFSSAAFKSWKAYVLATSLDENIELIGECLDMVSTARSVLRLAEAANLPLHPAHRSSLESSSEQEPPLQEQPLQPLLPVQEVALVPRRPRRIGKVSSRVASSDTQRPPSRGVVKAKASSTQEPPGHVQEARTVARWRRVSANPSSPDISDVTQRPLSRRVSKKRATGKQEVSPAMQQARLATWRHKGAWNSRGYSFSGFRRLTSHRNAQGFSRV